MPVSDVVAAALLQRMRRLTYAERMVLMRASVIGPRFSFAVLVSTGRFAAERVRAALDAVCSLEFVVRDDAHADWYTFRHALIREIAYQESVAAGLRPMHRKIVRALEQQCKNDDNALGDLAYHASAAGDAARSIRYNELAGDRALAAFASGEAHAYYRRASAFARTNSHDHRRLAGKIAAIAGDLADRPGAETEEGQSSLRRDCSTRSLPAVRWTPR